MTGKVIIAVCLLFSFVYVVFAAHPLISNDAWTAGKGKWSLELNGEYAHDDEDGIVSKETEIGMIFSYGLFDPLDVVIELPYIFTEDEEEDEVEKENGIGDILLQLKYCFLKKGGWNLAIAPAVSLPTGDYEKELGTGDANYELFFITTKEFEALAFHLNLGYIRNENKLEEKKDLWHASLAAEWEVVEEKFTIVGNVGCEENRDEFADEYPVFILCGVIYSLTEYCDIDLGLKLGLTDLEDDYAILFGVIIEP